MRGPVTAAFAAATVLVGYLGYTVLTSPSQRELLPINVRGTLRTDSGAPLRNLEFSVSGLTKEALKSKTDEGGAFELRNLRVAPGTHVLTFEAAGFKPRRDSLLIPEGGAGATFVVQPQLTLKEAPAVTNPNFIPPSPPPPVASPASSRSPSSLPTRTIRQGRGGNGTSQQVPALTWNVWAEEQPEGANEPTFSPKDVVALDASVVVTIDLAGIPYAAGGLGVSSLPASSSLSTFVNKWLNSAQNEVDLWAVIVADPAFFEGSLLDRKDLKVDIEKIREFSPAVPARPFELLKLDPKPSFQFGRASVALKPTGRKGWAPISIGIWTAQGRPIEDIPFAVCLGPDSSLAVEKACPGPKPSRTMLGGFDSLRASIGQPQSPDVAIDIVSMPGTNEVFGVMAASGEMFAWPIKGGAAQLTKNLGGPYFERFSTAVSDDDWLQAGEEMRGVLFPGVPGSDAAKALLRFDEALKAAKTPSVYVRVLQSPASPFVFPIGGLVSGGVPVGLLARLELPLPSQAFAGTGTCVDQWALVAPRTGFTGDRDLELARQSAGTAMDNWIAPLFQFDAMRKFGDWAKDGTADGRLTASTAVFILSHHADDTLRFTVEDKLNYGAIQRAFPEPSVVILNACGGARASSQEFVRRFNEQGATSIIATISEVEAEMAGEFSACWINEVEQLPPGGKPIGEVFYNARQCLSGIMDPKLGRSKWGAKVLKYVLLGDAGTRLCRPK